MVQLVIITSQSDQQENLLAMESGRPMFMYHHQSPGSQTPQSVGGITELNDDKQALSKYRLHTT